MAPVHYHQGGFPPTERLDWQRLAPILSSASFALGRYSDALENIPNSDILVSIMTRQEAVYSTRLEGSKANEEDILRYEAGQESASKSREEDIREVQNYRRALQKGRNLLAHQTLSQDIILDIHLTLLCGTRDHSKNPGAFRVIDNYIGDPGSTKHDARYLPVPYSMNA